MKRLMLVVAVLLSVGLCLAQAPAPPKMDEPITVTRAMLVDIMLCSMGTGDYVTFSFNPDNNTLVVTLNQEYIQKQLSSPIQKRDAASMASARSMLTTALKHTVESRLDLVLAIFRKHLGIDPTISYVGFWD